MLAKILSAAAVGLTVQRVVVEVDIASGGLPSFTLVGLPDKAVEESRERVRSAIKNSGGDFPARKITVNLAPADLPKSGPAYDLPIALGILVASGQLPPIPENALFIGELSLDGTLRHTNGILPVVAFAKDEGIPTVFVPACDAPEGALVSGVSVMPVPSLLSLFRHCTKATALEPAAFIPFVADSAGQTAGFDMADIRGQEHAKRALEIAAAGAHNLFMTGPPGAGKTMLARTIPSIMPPMTEREALEVTKIYSVTGNLPGGTALMSARPFRAPHHTTSRNGLIGGGTRPMPGEITLAHRGVLFLDEFPEYPRSVLEALRQPMEDGFVTVSRAAGSVTFPSDFVLVAAANPCPCGNYGSETKRCTCPPGSVVRYQRRISGPILDRIDLHLDVPSVESGTLIGEAEAGESSVSVRTRVSKARERQLVRFSKTAFVANAELPPKAVREFCPLSSDVARFLAAAVSRFGLSARSYFRMVKVSRTIADMDGVDDIAVTHVAEALQYRPEKPDP